MDNFDLIYIKVLAHLKTVDLSTNERRFKIYNIPLVDDVLDHMNKFVIDNTLLGKFKQT